MKDHNTFFEELAEVKQQGLLDDPIKQMTSDKAEQEDLLKSERGITDDLIIDPDKLRKLSLDRADNRPKSPVFKPLQKVKQQDAFTNSYAKEFVDCMNIHNITEAIDNGDLSERNSPVSSFLENDTDQTVSDSMSSNRANVSRDLFEDEVDQLSPVGEHTKRDHNEISDTVLMGNFSDLQEDQIKSAATFLQISKLGNSKDVAHAKEVLSKPRPTVNAIKNSSYSKNSKIACGFQISSKIFGLVDEHNNSRIDDNSLNSKLPSLTSSLKHTLDPDNKTPGQHSDMMSDQYDVLTNTMYLMKNDSSGTQKNREQLNAYSKDLSSELNPAQEAKAISLFSKSIQDIYYSPTMTSKEKLEFWDKVNSFTDKPLDAQKSMKFSSFLCGIISRERCESLQKVFDKHNEPVQDAIKEHDKRERIAKADLTNKRFKEAGQDVDKGLKDLSQMLEENSKVVMDADHSMGR